MGLVTETNKLIFDWLTQSCTDTRAIATTSVCYTLPLYRIAVPLDTFSRAAVSGAYLQYGSTRLFDPRPKVTLTVGVTNQRVFCVQATGPVPTSIEWYNPQGQLVSGNNREEVNQGIFGCINRASTLNFGSYQQSQGGRYECRVACPGNNSESLSVCIGEGQAWGEGCRLLSIIALCLTHFTHTSRIYIYIYIYIQVWRY